MTRVDYIASLPLPSWAMHFGDVYFESAIPGYRTLKVEGRETLDSEIETIAHLGDGEVFLRKRNDARTIRVSFCIEANSLTGLREKLNKLDSYLDRDQVEIIFADEPDKYFVGTKASAEYKLENTHATTGTIEIYCPDPHKYSMTLYEATADANDEIAINYDGTAPAWPILTAEAASDLGYVSFVDAEGHVLQVGDPEELDDADHPKMETLIWDIFSTEDKLGTWTNNNATLESDIAAYLQQGSVKKTTNGMVVNSFGTERDVRFGPSKTKAVPADSTGHVGAANCYFQFYLDMYAANVKMAQEVIAELTGTVNGSKTVIASIHVTKSGTGNFNGNIYLYVMGKQKKKISWNAAANNKWFGKAGYGQCWIRKDGDKFTFMINGESSLFETKVAGTEDYEVTEVSIFFNRKKGIAPVTLCAVDNIIFNSYSVANWVDVPNKFKAGDEITCQTGDGMILVNDVPQDGLGALGNDWEQFTLKPGVNSIKCLYSDWAATKPTFTLCYRKVYL